MFQNPADSQYLSNAKKLLAEAQLAENRTDTSAYKLFGTHMSFDLRDGLPLLTTKKVHLKSIIHELLWFLKGETNIKYLNDNGCRIWDEWATKDGELGPVYGAQWRFWTDTKTVTENSEAFDKLTNLGYQSIGKLEDTDTVVLQKNVDQIDEVMNTLRNNPLDRRMIVTAYNPGVKPTTALAPHENAEIGLQALPPCHMMFHLNASPMTEDERLEYVIGNRVEEIMSDEQWLENATSRINIDGDPLNVAREKAVAEFNYLVSSEQATVSDVLTHDYNAPEYFLDMQMYQRSADWFLGVPFNIASYSLLLMMFAQQANMVARNFVHAFGDYHIYENHVDVIKTQLEQPQKELPIMKLKKADSIDSYTYDDFELVGYEHGPVLKGKVAV